MSSYMSDKSVRVVFCGHLWQDLEKFWPKYIQQSGWKCEEKHVRVDFWKRCASSSTGWRWYDELITADSQSAALLLDCVEVWVGEPQFGADALRPPVRADLQSADFHSEMEEPRSEMVQVSHTSPAAWCHAEKQRGAWNADESFGEKCNRARRRWRRTHGRSWSDLSCIFFYHYYGNKWPTRLVKITHQLPGTSGSPGSIHWIHFKSRITQIGF